MNRFARAIIFTALCFLIVFPLAARAADFEITEDVTFTTQGGVDLKADVFVPEGEGPFPIVVAVHGGGFVQGDKHDIHRKCKTLAAGGYVVFDANYRTLSYGVQFPAFVQDIHTAVKWIKKHAAEYRGDASLVAITGFSAGSYIASLTAVTWHVKKLQHKDEGLEDVTSKVQAVIPFYGHHDLTILDPVQRETARFIWGGSVSDKLLRLASPVNYLDHAVPTLLFHNLVDSLVPVEQSRSMFKHLQETDVPVYYYEFPETAHDLLRKDEDWALGVTLMFLDKYLKGVEDIELPDSIPPREGE